MPLAHFDPTNTTTTTPRPVPPVELTISAVDAAKVLRLSADEQAACAHGWKLIVPKPATGGKWCCPMCGAGAQ